VVPRTFLELFLMVRGTFLECSPYIIKMEPKITYMEHFYNILVWLPKKKKLMRPFYPKGYLI